MISHKLAKVTGVLVLFSSGAWSQDFPVSPLDNPTGQAGAVSVDMGEGVPGLQQSPATTIVAIYRGPGYFDESLLDIPSSPQPPTPPDSASENSWDAVPPPSALPDFPAPPDLPSEGTNTPSPDQFQQDEWSQDASSEEPLPPPPPVLGAEIGTDEVLPPPPSLESLPAFPEEE